MTSPVSTETPLLHRVAEPPTGELGGPSTARTVLFRNADIAVAVSRVVAYSTGFEFALTVRTAEPISVWARDGYDGSPRLTITFSDGSTPRVVARTEGGGGGMQRWDVDYWVEGLPPAGPVTVTVTLPGLADQRGDLEAADIVEAASRAEPVWPASGGQGRLLPLEGPDDGAAAKRAIERAITGLMDLDPESGRLRNVDGGDNLGGAVHRMRDRQPQVAGRVTTRPDHITFINARQAAVGYTVLVNGQPVLGERHGWAVLVDGRWKISRETFCDLAALAGVSCPPRAGR